MSERHTIYRLAGAFPGDKMTWLSNWYDAKDKAARDGRDLLQQHASVGNFDLSVKLQEYAISLMVETPIVA